jgi:hypothetical protein
MTRCWIFDIKDELPDEMPNLFGGQVQVGARGQGSVKARNYLVDRLKATHANVPMTGHSDS